MGAGSLAFPLVKTFNDVHFRYSWPRQTGYEITGISSARSLTVSRESFEVTVSGGSTFARVKLKEIDGMAPQDVERAV